MCLTYDPPYSLSSRADQYESCLIVSCNKPVPNSREFYVRELQFVYCMVQQTFTNFLYRYYNDRQQPACGSHRVYSTSAQTPSAIIAEDRAIVSMIKRVSLAVVSIVASQNVSAFQQPNQYSAFNESYFL